MRDLPPTIWIAAGAALLVAWIALWLGAKWRGWRRTRLAQRRMRRANLGEDRAAGWLQDRGFEIVGVQATAEYPVYVDGEPTMIGLRADYVVSKGGALFVAEVKTGSSAPRIDTASTRRQLLEYRVAFNVDGVLLVDAENGTVHSVEFPGFQ